MKAKAKVRVAVIGLNWGKYHVQILANNPACEVAALCDLKEDFAQQIVKRGKTSGQSLVDSGQKQHSSVALSIVVCCYLVLSVVKLPFLHP